MAANSIVLSVLFLLLCSICPSLQSEGVMTFGKNHLKAFGYLSGDYTSTDDASYDEALASALRKYQTFFGLNVTGRIEPDTLTMMSRPRCGVPDHPLTGDVHNITLQYAFYDGKPRWHMKHLTYYIGSKPLPFKTTKDVIASAFSKWSHASGLQFKQVMGTQKNPPIRIGTYKGDHGDGHPFDGKYGTFAHAFRPTLGALHFDGDEEWGTVQAPNILDLESVALHEIGHLLGLRHSTVAGALMFSSFEYGQIMRHLSRDDIDGIRALYAD